MIVFIAGFILGGMFGVFMTAILQAGRDDR
jgi:hypothetical protein